MSKGSGEMACLPLLDPSARCHTINSPLVSCLHFHLCSWDLVSCSSHHLQIPHCFQRGQIQNGARKCSLCKRAERLQIWIQRTVSSLLAYSKKTIAGLFWVRCKSEILIQYCLCEQVYNLKAELCKTQREDTYIKNNMIEILVKVLIAAFNKKVNLIDFYGIFLSSWNFKKILYAFL